MASCKPIEVVCEVRWVPMKYKVPATALTSAKYVGLFALARILTSCKLRILCYHRTALRDEERYKPTLFLRRRVDVAGRGKPLSGFPAVLTFDDESTITENE